MANEQLYIYAFLWIPLLLLFYPTLLLFTLSVFPVIYLFIIMWAHNFPLIHVLYLITYSIILVIIFSHIWVSHQSPYKLTPVFLCMPLYFLGCLPFWTKKLFSRLTLTFSNTGSIHNLRIPNSFQWSWHQRPRPVCQMCSLLLPCSI